MSGVQYLVDNSGRKSAVVIDLKRHGGLWEDFYDAWLAHSRRRETRETLDQVKAHLRKAGKLHA